MDDVAPDLVIGVGNPLMGDDGIGIAAVTRLRDEWEWDDDVTFVDGGTWGMNLLHLIEGARRLLFLDAIDAGEPAGTQIILTRAEIPRYFALKLSPHQIDLREVLALAELRGALPETTMVMGLQPDRVELSLELSPVADAQIDALVSAVHAQLERWGHRAAPIASPHRPSPTARRPIICTS